MKLKAFFLLLLIGILAIGVVYGAGIYGQYRYEQNIRHRFAENAIPISELEITETRIKVKIPSTGKTLCPEDLDLVRYLQDRIPSLLEERGIHVVLCTGEGKVIYSNYFNPESQAPIEIAEAAPLYMDSVLLKKSFEVALKKREIVCLLYTEAYGDGCGIVGEEPAPEGRTVSLQLQTEEDRAEKVSEFFVSLIDDLNRQGAGIVRCNLWLTGSEGKTLWMESRDLLTENRIRLEP